MSKLFELYVLGLLKDEFGERVTYHLSTSGNELDFLLNDDKYKVVIDAKYKPVFIGDINHDDIRQVSGYARLEVVYDQLKLNNKELIDCLIVYPDPDSNIKRFKNVDIMDIHRRVNGYVGVYKLGIELPAITII